MLQMTVRQMTVVSLCLVLLLAVTVDSRYLPTRGQEDRLDRLRDLLRDVSPFSFSIIHYFIMFGGGWSCVIPVTSAKVELQVHVVLHEPARSRAKQWTLVEGIGQTYSYVHFRICLSLVFD